MGGGVEVEEFPYSYAYRGYPFGARRVPVYDSSNPVFWNDGWGSPHGDSVYGGRAGPMYGDVNGDADSFARKRKLDGLKGEELSSRGRNVIRSFPVENGSMASEGLFPSKPRQSPTVSFSDRATTPAHGTQSSHANAATFARHPSASNSVRGGAAAQPRVISIPVTSSDDQGKGQTVKCTVIPQEGTKKLRKALFDEAAAVLIQARFRGYQVRKTAPLSQLRRIANVKSQLKEFKEKAADVEFINYARENSVAKLKLTEGLMNLLLQLDSIQGAHPDVRAVRKVVTKEVVSLQGRVDSLLTAEMAKTESSELPMEIEGEGLDEGDGGDRQLTATEPLLSDSAATATDMSKEEESDPAECAEPDPDQDKGEITKVEEILEEMKFEECEVDDVAPNRSCAAQMVDSEPDEGTTQVLRDEDNRELKETVESDPDDGMTDVLITEEDNLNPMETSCAEPDPDEGMTEVQTEEDEHEPTDHEDDGCKVDDNLVSVESSPQAAEVTIVEPEGEFSTIARASERFPHESLQRDEELVVKRNGNGLQSEGDLDIKRCDGLHAKGEQSPEVASSPYSPKSPLEAANWLNFQPSNSDSEPEAAEIVQGASAQSKPDNDALLQKLSEENKVLKSLLVTVMKWNQMQATTMQDVRHRLGKLESRVANRKSNSRRKGGKTRR